MHGAKFFRSVAVILVAGAVLCALPGGVWAHPPGKVEITFDLASNELHVIADHNTNNTKNHRIDKITVWVNDKEFEYLYDEQSSKEKLDVKIVQKDVKEGDTIKVRIHCNRFGWKTVETTASKAQPAEKPKE